MTGWVIVALLCAAVCALMLTRLPDQVLQDSGVTCRLEEDS